MFICILEVRDPIKSGHCDRKRSAKKGVMPWTHTVWALAPYSTHSTDTQARGKGKREEEREKKKNKEKKFLKRGVRALKLIFGPVFPQSKTSA